MDPSEGPSDRPTVSEINTVFQVNDIRTDGNKLLYIGQPLEDPRSLIRTVWPVFRNYGYQVSLKRGYESADCVPVSGCEFVLVASPSESETGRIPWLNVLLFVATAIVTLLVGATQWYHIPVRDDPLRIWEAWPFPVAILGVLITHELAHYLMGRYHGVDASLPYFIPFPSLIGTMGAVIRMRGQIPDRRALFDIGAAGPLAGIVATIFVTIIGLQLDPLPVQQATQSSGDVIVRFGHPPLLEIIAFLTGTAEKLHSSRGLHPVVFGGWIGMFLTVLNLLPVGQLDGGHILRALIGESQRSISAAIPGALFALAAYLLFIRESFDSVLIWTLWGMFTMGLAYAGPATPIEDEQLDRTRVAFGLLTFLLGVLCFTPVPFMIDAA